MFGLGGVGQVGKVRIKRALGATGGAPSLGPSLDLDFMTPGVFPPNVVFTRASTGTYFDSAGVIQTAAANGPRWDYGPGTHVLNGLLIEESRANLVFPSVISTPGWVVTGPHVLGGSITLPDGTTSTTALLAATSTANTMRYVGLAAPPTATIGQVFTVSAYLRKSSASNAFLQTNNAGATSVAYYDLTNGVAVVGADLVAGIITKSAAITPASNGWFRVSFTFTAAFNGIIPPLFGPCAVVSATGDNRAAAGVVGEGIYIWGAQVEVGAMASSYIATTSAAVTRAAEFCSLSTGAWFNASASSLVADYMLRQSPNPSTLNWHTCGLNDGTTNNRMLLVGQNSGTTQTKFQTLIANVSTVSSTLGDTVANKAIKLAAAWNGSSATGSFAGGSTITAAVGVPSGITTLSIGTSYPGPNTHLNGHIRRVRYWPRPLSATELVQETTLTDPTLDFDFTKDGFLDPLLTFTRSTTATYFDSTGTMRTAAANAPRWDYDINPPSLRGLLIEEQRTNQIKNSTMVGAVAGSPGTPPTDWAAPTTLGLTQTIVGTGTESGIAYIDYRFSGTTTGGGMSISFSRTTTNGLVVLPSTQYSFTCYFSFVGGTRTNLGNINLITYQYTSAGTFIVALINTPTQAVLYPNNGDPLTKLRFGGPMTGVTAATAAFVQAFMQINLVAGPVDFTIRIGAPQLEAGVFPSSFIPTSTVAVARSPDYCSTPMAPWLNPAASTLAAHFMLRQSPNPSTNTQHALSLSDGTFTNRLELLGQNTGVNASNATAFSNAAGVATGTPVLGTVVPNLSMRLAAGWDGTKLTGALNGEVSAPTSPAAMPSGLNVLAMGVVFPAATNGTSINGHMRRAKYWPRMLSDTELQQVTVLDPVAPPDFTIDFMTPGVLDPAITFTRASAATYLGSDGVLRIAGVDQPRWSYDRTTGVLNGLHMEKAGTNLCLQSENLAQNVWNRSSAVVGPPLVTANSGSAPDAKTTATQGQWPAVTGVGAASAVEQDVIATATAYTFSVYLSMIGTGNLYLYATADHVTFYSTPVASNFNWTRYSLTTPPLTAAKWSFGIGTDLRDAAQVATASKIVGMWGAQIEAGEFASSYIATSATPVSRAIDIMNTPVGPWFNPSESTLYSEFIYPRLVADKVTAHDVCFLRASANGDRLVLRAMDGYTTRAIFYTVTSAAPSINTTLSNTPVTTAAKMAVAFTATSGTGSYNGGATATAPRPLPTGLDGLVLGGQDSASGQNAALDGYLRRVSYWRRALTNSELQRVTL